MVPVLQCALLCSRRFLCLASLRYAYVQPLSSVMMAWKGYCICRAFAEHGDLDDVWAWQLEQCTTALSHSNLEVGCEQVFSTREVHKALRVHPAGSQGAESATPPAAPAGRPQWRTGGTLQLTQALYTLQRQLDGQPISCQLLPNRDGSFAVSVRGQGLISCSTVTDCERLFHEAFPQVGALLYLKINLFPCIVAACKWRMRT